MYKKCTLVKIKNAKKMQNVYAFPVVFYTNIYKILQTDRYKKDTLGKNQKDSKKKDNQAGHLLSPTCGCFNERASKIQHITDFHNVLF